MTEAGKPPIPTQTKKEHVFKFAEEFGRAVQFQIGDPLEPLVARLGGTISYDEGSHDVGGIPESISVRSFRDFTIYLPLNTSRERDRFTVAHELGHLFLHYPLVQKRYGAHAFMVATRWVDETNADLQRTEWEANWFAAALLMPQFAIEAAFGANSRDIAATAARFGVTEMAISVRAKTLGL